MDNVSDVSRCMRYHVRERCEQMHVHIGQREQMHALSRT
jgi:hypothetical protein